MDFLATISDPNKKMIVMYGNVYDVAAYFQGQSQPGFFGDNMYTIFTNMRNGQDATALMDQLRQQNPVYYRNVLNCMNNIFYIGTVDNRNSLRCRLSNIILVAASGVIAFVILFKFLAALFIFGGNNNPQQINKYVMIQISCYTEGKESLEATLNSIAVTRFDDNYKFAVVICDGMVTGGENSRSTPDLVLEILYGSEGAANEAKEKAHEPMVYFAVGEGYRAENRGQVFSGIYEIEGHQLPFIVIIKTGNEIEKTKPGNRGKRDSQVLLMRFLHNIYAREPLTQLEYAIYHEMKDIMGLSPEVFEYMLMVDGDTSVTQDSIRKMVHHMNGDDKTIALCGETFVANEKDSWTTMIQVYEYFISHHLAKAFESMFGSVTCLPGCFCMYRIRTEKNVPLLIAPALIDDYADANVNTLHKKNLLHLGEDRYLTTLVLKHFRRYKTRYTSDAQCHTNAPDTWSVLLSQRRRWINSTIHNLMELVLNIRDLCGFCCFSMRFVVLLDLFSTIVAPSAVVYVGYLIYTIIFERNTTIMISLIMIGAIYGLQMIIILFKFKWEHVIWMIIYILAMPLFNFYMPLYSFWHMDDFNWGNTRIVINDNGKELQVDADDVSYYSSTIERKHISEWESEWKSNEDDDVTPVPSFASKADLVMKYPVAPAMSHVSAIHHAALNTTSSMVAASTFSPSMIQQTNFQPIFQTHFPSTQFPQMQQYPYATSCVLPPPPPPIHVASYVGHTYPHPHPYPYAMSEIVPQHSIGPSMVDSYVNESECYPQESASNIGYVVKRRKHEKNRESKKKRKETREKKHGKHKKREKQVEQECGKQQNDQQQQDQQQQDQQQNDQQQDQQQNDQENKELSINTEIRKMEETNLPEITRSAESIFDYMFQSTTITVDDAKNDEWNDWLNKRF
jgi:cellulose synthase/poly-beta-1,6-N-acetylglucosamine synthase-like glycosyltransferase